MLCIPFPKCCSANVTVEFKPFIRTLPVLPAGRVIQMRRFSVEELTVLTEF